MPSLIPEFGITSRGPARREGCALARVSAIHTIVTLFLRAASRIPNDSGLYPLVGTSR
jgi:hypothetical protein